MAPNEMNLSNLGDGALMECATAELRKICANIADPNFKTDAKRKLQINIVIKPDGSGSPYLMLVEADGGRWKIDAIATIKAAVEAFGLTIPIIA